MMPRLLRLASLALLIAAGAALAKPADPLGLRPRLDVVLPRGDTPLVGSHPRPLSLQVLGAMALRDQPVTLDADHVLLTGRRDASRRERAAVVLGRRAQVEAVALVHPSRAADRSPEPSPALLTIFSRSLATRDRWSPVLRAWSRASAPDRS